MTYAVTNPPVLIVQSIAGPRVWIYTSADAAGDIDAAGYITDGDSRGMKLNDLVIVNDTATPLQTIHVVQSVTAGGAVNLGAGTTVGSATTGD
jgi:lipid-binding SYLF domain-containing protein